MKFMDNKVVKVVVGIVKVVVTLFIVCVFSIIFFQRVSNNQFNLGGYGLYTVVSESMLPKYELWDMILVRQVDVDDIQVGDDVVYKGEVGDFKDKIVTHRVIDIQKNGNNLDFVTKGINNDVSDPVVHSNQVLGRVVIKSGILSFLSKLINNIYGFYFLIFVPLVVIIVLEVLEMIHERREIKKELEE